ncbi:MAG TPA: VCBS repeat-containing protein [Candidatus Didemnitutus sp.]|nr:VCBS repeat-containing protein [Candidatus Didemnitutus sp.]
MVREVHAKLRRMSWSGLLLGMTLAAAEPPPGISAAPLAPRSGPRGATMFTELMPAETCIVTANKYDDPAMWVERYAEFSTGALGTGVAIGDCDGDGRPDIFVVSKTESCRLFRNLGNWKFEDVTEKAGVADVGDAARIWKQGATFVDVNNDGLLDIYVCRFNAPNLLYINQGDGAGSKAGVTFREEAAARGLAVNDASVMAAFCDYDRDGWLDVFIQTNAPEAIGQPHAQRNYLFHNNGDGTFTDVTERAGISGKAQGHSAIWWDYDGDGWPDLYVANDFTPADQLWHNNQNGTFTDTINAVVPRMPFSSMGADLGDINNDGLIDLFVADMAATNHQKDQRTMANARRRVVEPAAPGPAGSADNSPAIPYGMRNMLYVNTGTGRFLEAAFLAGLSATDWTWSVRFEDLDNDGRVDLHVTNGMYREPHNADLMARIAAAETPADKIRIDRASPVLTEQHFAFRNLGDLRFEDVSVAWGLNQKGVSFGAAFGDLDGDGDLDLVYANYKKGVTILRNDSDTGHRVIFALRGTRSNRFGVGATVQIETASGVQVRSLVLARGVVSSSEPVLHFGLGDETAIKRVTVSWSSGNRQVFTDLAADRKYTITESTGGAAPEVKTGGAAKSQFTEVSEAVNLALRSREASIAAESQGPLLPMRQNRRGPAVAVGDIDGDGKDDVIVGGTTLDPARVRRANGDRFVDASVMLPANVPLDDGPVLLFDANGDGRNDLLVTKAGAVLPAGAEEYQPQLWFGDGKGKLQLAPDGALPPLPISVGAVAAADFDRDGRLDLFIGGRVQPGAYPSAPKSALLANRGGRFEDVTDTLAPGLREVGMVTSALWSDADGDGWLDLLVTLEWGTVKYFHNNAGKGFSDWTENAGFATAGTAGPAGLGAGWWNSIASADFNGDGRPDYVVGNLGLNTQYHADAAHPALLFVGDFNGDGASQLIEAYYEGDKLYPWRTRSDLGAAIPAILKKFSRNDLYAKATLGEILGEDKLAAARRFAATEFRSGVFLSQPGGAYRFEPLPQIAQVAPIQGLVAGDFDGDGHADIYVVQNSYAPIPVVGRFDGGLGQLLRGDGHGHFTAVPATESGLTAPGDAKALAVLDLNGDGWPDFLVSRNNSTTLVFENRGTAGLHSLGVRLRGPVGNPAAIGARVALELGDGAMQTAEISSGSGYYSQSTATCFFGWTDANPPRRLRVRWPSGAETDHAVPPGGSQLVIEASSPR